MSKLKKSKKSVGVIETPKQAPKAPRETAYDSAVAGSPPISAAKLYRKHWRVQISNAVIGMVPEDVLDKMYAELEKL